jgi:ATP-dependent Lhr-like helicase
MTLSTGRWELSRPLIKRSIEDELELIFDQVLILCRETVRNIPGCNISWDAALEVLRMWEYTGRVRRGYFVSGMSGAQYIRAQDFEQVTRALDRPEAVGSAGSGVGGSGCRSDLRGGAGVGSADCDDNSIGSGVGVGVGGGGDDSSISSADIIWLPAADPSQPWGKCLKHIDGRAFMNISGTTVALLSGIPVAVFERHGQVLRVFDHVHAGTAIETFVREFQLRRIFPNLNRATVKQYPESVENVMSKAGFSRELGDYILYWDEYR